MRSDVMWTSFTKMTRYFEAAYVELKVSAVNYNMVDI